MEEIELVKHELLLTELPARRDLPFEVIRVDEGRLSARRGILPLDYLVDKIGNDFQPSAVFHVVADQLILYALIMSFNPLLPPQQSLDARGISGRPPIAEVFCNLL